MNPFRVNTRPRGVRLVLGNPEPFAFQLGSGNVIPGWDEGLLGMGEGGRRQLVIPPDLAYGRQGQPPAIGPNATLVFVIDLTSVQ